MYDMSGEHIQIAGRLNSRLILKIQSLLAGSVLSSAPEGYFPLLNAS